MATICDNPFSIPAIDLEECIGTSLATINSNFNDLRSLDCLTFDEIQRIETNLVNLSAQFFSLSASVPAFSRAWVSFSVEPGNTPVIRSSHNIESIIPLSTGVYALSFTTAFTNPTSYALIGTCKSVQAVDGYVWVQPTTFTSTSANINIRNLSGTFVNPEYVSITIFNK